jgi:hypothetical protein
MFQISGLTLRSDDVGLAILYLATVQALAVSFYTVELLKGNHLLTILVYINNIETYQSAFL